MLEDVVMIITTMVQDNVLHVVVKIIILFVDKMMLHIETDVKWDVKIIKD